MVEHFYENSQRVKATEPLLRDSLLFTTWCPEVPGTHLIDPERMTD